jgi:hypothetical protein
LDGPRVGNPRKEQLLTPRFSLATEGGGTPESTGQFIRSDQQKWRRFGARIGNPAAIIFREDVQHAAVIVMASALKIFAPAIVVGATPKKVDGKFPKSSNVPKQE